MKKATTERTLLLEEHLRTPLDWSSTKDAERPFRARLGGDLWMIQLNDFPAEPMYTLLVDGKKVGDFDEWPAAWKRRAERL